MFIPILLEYAGHKNGKKRIRIIAPMKVKITAKEAEMARKANAEIRKSDHVIFDLMIADADDVIIGVPDPLSDEINHAIAIWVSNTSFARLDYGTPWKKSGNLRRKSRSTWVSSQTDK